MALMAYLDTNVVSQIATAGDPSHDVAPSMVEALEAAVAEGRLVVPGSDVVLKELAATPETVAPGPTTLGLRYRRLMSRNHFLKPVLWVLKEALDAAKAGVPAPSPHIAPEDLARTPPSDFDPHTWLAQQSEALQRDKKLFQVSHRELRKLAKKDWAEEKASEGVEDPDPTDPVLWELLMPHYTEQFLRQKAGWGAVRPEDTALLLRQSTVVRVYIAFYVSLMIAQTLEGEKSDRGDHADRQHVTLAAAIDAPFVTHDLPLADRLRRHPGVGVTPLTLTELLARL